MLEIFPSAALGIPLWFDARNELQAVPFIPLVLLPRSLLAVLCGRCNALACAALVPALPAHARYGDLAVGHPCAARLQEWYPAPTCLAACAEFTIALGVLVCVDGSAPMQGFQVWAEDERGGPETSPPRRCLQDEGGYSSPEPFAAFSMSPCS
jgi:hypothetical protein